MRNRRIKRKRIRSINVPSVWVDSDDKVSATLTTTNDVNGYIDWYIAGYDEYGRPIWESIKKENLNGQI